jgi:hypothetical protein
MDRDWRVRVDGLGQVDPRGCKKASWIVEHSTGAPIDRHGHLHARTVIRKGKVHSIILPRPWGGKGGGLHNPKGPYYRKFNNDSGGTTEDRSTPVDHNMLSSFGNQGRRGAVTPRTLMFFTYQEGSKDPIPGPVPPGSGYKVLELAEQVVVKLKRTGLYGAWEGTVLMWFPVVFGRESVTMGIPSMVG